MAKLNRTPEEVNVLCTSRGHEPACGSSERAAVTLFSLASGGKCKALTSLALNGLKLEAREGETEVQVS